MNVITTKRIQNKQNNTFRKVLGREWINIELCMFRRNIKTKQGQKKLYDARCLRPQPSANHLEKAVSEES